MSNFVTEVINAGEDAIEDAFDAVETKEQSKARLDNLLDELEAIKSRAHVGNMGFQQKDIPVKLNEILTGMSNEIKICGDLIDRTTKAYIGQQIIYIIGKLNFFRTIAEGTIAAIDQNKSDSYALLASLGFPNTVPGFGIISPNTDSENDFDPDGRLEA